MAVSSPVRSPIRSPIYAPTSGKWGASAYVFVNAEAAALVARFTTPATEARKPLIDNLVGSLKAASIWTKLDALYILAAETAQAARQNWVQDLYNLSAVNAPTFAADRGYAGDGSTSYLRTNFNPSTAVSPLFTQNSAHVSVSDRTSRAASTVVQIGGWVTGTSLVAEIGTRAVGDQVLGRVNQSSTASAPTNANSDGRFVASRTGASLLSIYRNATSLGAPNNASVAIANIEFYICAINQSGTPALMSTDQLSQASVGGALSGADATAFDVALSTYLTAVGA